MARIVLKHETGSKALQEEQFELEGSKEITIGRDPACTVRYDPERDDLVSRRHARITLKSTEPLEFEIEDLGSRNGTFVNNERVYGRRRLNHGDVVRFAPAGPSFRFEIEPPPVRPTRPIEVEEARPAPIPPTQEASATWPPRELDRAAAPATPAPPVREGPVGRRTIEQMLGEIRRQLRLEYLVAAVLLIVILALAGVFFYRRFARKPADQPLSAEEIARRNTDAVVLVLSSWKLVDNRTGRQLYHVHFLNQIQERAGGRPVKVFEQLGERVPLFVQTEGRIQPLLSYSDGGGLHKPIGGQAVGSGFIVRSDGFLLTNRHLAAAWETPYNWPAESGGLLVDESGKMDARPLTSQQLPRDWIPVKPGPQPSSAPLGTSILYRAPKRLVPVLAATPAALEGRLDYLDVVFARTTLRTKARLIRSSERHDVALAKIDLPQPLRAVEISPAYGSIAQGTKVVVLAYQTDAVSATVMRQSKEAKQTTRALPDPAVDEGYVVSIHKAGQPVPGLEGLVESGDSFELGLRTGAAVSTGGPVFDDRGRVIAMLYASRTGRDAPASYAVPIGYGIEIMNVGRASQ